MAWMNKNVKNPAKKLYLQLFKQINFENPLIKF